MSEEELSLKIAGKIFDQIERDRTLILQTIADVVLDELLLHKAKAAPVKLAVEPKAETQDGNCSKRMTEIIAETIRKRQDSWWDLAGDKSDFSAIWTSRVSS